MTNSGSKKKRIWSNLIVFSLLALLSACANTSENPGTFAKSLRSPLKISVFHAKDNSLFNVNSEIISGEKEAIIVDTQFEKSNAVALAEQAKALNKQVTTIFISQNAPDFYFGAAELAKAFPEAQIVSTPQTSQIIEKSYKAEQDLWNPRLKQEAPERIIIPTPLTGNKLRLEGHDLLVMGLTSDDPDHTYLWLPENKIILGGTSVQEGLHLWVANTPRKFQRDAWIKRLKKMLRLAPEGIIPGRSVVTDFSKPLTTTVVTQNLHYLRKLGRTIRESRDSNQAIDQMQNLFPNLADLANLKMSIQVLLGKLPWNIYSSFPAYSRKLIVVFNKQVAYDFTFRPEEMTITGTRADTSGENSTQAYQTVLIGPLTYLVSWVNSTTEVKQTLVVDFANKLAYSNTLNSEDTDNPGSLVGKITLK